MHLKSAFGRGIEIRIFRWAGFARPSENPYKFRATKVFVAEKAWQKSSLPQSINANRLS